MKTVMNSKLKEVAERSGIEESIILKFISDEWITPVDPSHNLFDEEDVERIKLIWDLQETFGVNDEAVPIILHLIDQLNHLHHDFKKINK
ncbi:MAG: chaperone modulator CbpM [Bacteriovorax sp.]